MVSVAAKVCILDLTLWTTQGLPYQCLFISLVLACQRASNFDEEDRETPEP